MKEQIYNPFLPSWEYIPDIEPRVFGDRLYLYGSHDRFGGRDFCLNDYVGWSAPLDDLSGWQYGGVILRAKDDPENTDGKQTIFAPDCVQGPDGRYYLFYCLSRTPLVSVAVSDRAAGPFAFCGHVRTAEGRPYGGRGSVFGFDPGVLVDDDGRIWLYTGYGPGGEARTSLQRSGMQVDGCYCVELEPDMLTAKGRPVLVAPCAAVAAGTGFEGHAFFEAASPRKIGGRYYLVYSSQLSHELCYAVSDRPDGGFAYGGTIVSIGDVGLDGNTAARNYLGNTHGGLVELNGQWYIFYHRQTNRLQFSRQCCAEPVTIGPDGRIAQAELTSCGLNGGPLRGTGTYEARIACNLSSAEGTCGYSCSSGAVPGETVHPYFTQTEPDREAQGDQYIANLRDGSWAGFKYFRFDRENRITVSVRGEASGLLMVSTERGGPPAAQLRISPSRDWTEVSDRLCVSAGVHPLYFTFSGAGSLDFRRFTLSEKCTTALDNEAGMV